MLLDISCVARNRCRRLHTHPWRLPILPEIERLTVTMPPELAAVVRQADDYASTSEVVRAALRDWTLKRALRIEELVALKADIDRGWPTSRRPRQGLRRRSDHRPGRKLLADRSPSA